MTFAQALAQIPADVPRKHHGRDPAEGIDCLGFVLVIYRAIGVPFDDVDIPYSRNDHRRPHRYKEVERRFNRRLIPIKVDGTYRYRDGDIWLVGETTRCHVGVVVGDYFWDMRERLTKTTASRLAPHVIAAWRHPSLEV
jgi:cell wall-associated NlpC family hydrolase